VRGEAILRDGDVTELRGSIARRDLGTETGNRFARERASTPGVVLQLRPERPRTWDLAAILPR
jgi:hypothetical protein